MKVELLSGSLGLCRIISLDDCSSIRKATVCTVK